MQDKKNAVTEVADGEIRFEHVDFSYAGEGGNLSLKDVNLHIKSGQTIGIIGGTGSAKSTLVQLIPRLYDVTKGTVKVGGLHDHRMITCRKFFYESICLCKFADSLNLFLAGMFISPADIIVNRSCKENVFLQYHR